MPPSPLFLPHSKPPSDLAFNGDLAQPAVSEPPTDVSASPVTTQKRAVSELEGSCLRASPTSLSLAGETEAMEEVYVTCRRTQISQPSGHPG